MGFCGWCLLDTGIVYLVINSSLQGHALTLSLPRQPQTQRQTSNPFTEDNQKIQRIYSSLTIHDF